MDPSFPSSERRGSPDGCPRRLAPIRRRLVAFRRDPAGATAVEFALVALPFLALLAGTLELGITAWAQGALQDSVADAARQVYTGKFQQDNAKETDSTKILANFKKLICEQAAAKISLFDCSAVRISIRPAGSFGSASFANPSGSGTGGWNNSFSNYTCGASGSIMVIQAAVTFPVVFTFYGPGAPLPGNQRMLQAASVFKVEPFGTQCS